MKFTFGYPIPIKTMTKYTSDKVILERLLKQNDMDNVVNIARQGYHDCPWRFRNMLAIIHPHLSVEQFQDFVEEILLGVCTDCEYCQC